MIYPSNFESKIGFDDIRQLLKQRCLSTLGKEAVDGVSFSGDSAQVNLWLRQVREFRLLTEKEDAMPLSFFFDMREAVSRLRLDCLLYTSPSPRDEAKSRMPSSA